MKYAWTENNRIRDISFHDDVANSYHPDVAKNYVTQVPDDAQPGWELINGVWTAPKPIEPIADQVQT